MIGVMFQVEIKSEIKEDISFLIKVNNHSWNYICECGEARALTLKEIQKTKAIFISHTHIDHFINFDTILRHQIGTQRRIVICGPSGIAKQVQSKIKAYTWNLIEAGDLVYEIREIESPNAVRVYELESPGWVLKELEAIHTNTVFEEAVFRVSFIILDHKIPTIAYKFEGNDVINIDLKQSAYQGGKWVRDLKNAFENGKEDELIFIEDKSYRAKDLFHLLHCTQGDSVGIIMDHAASPANHAKIINHFSDCNKVFIESFYKEIDKDLAVQNFHSYSTMSGMVMKKANVAEAIPVHFSRKYNEDEIAELIQEFEDGMKADILK